ncbi:DUF6233 domain-containing protein [Streptomyces althioticus]|uniref:DUF6233 domain-containing protein n=1 Tax=Streptomyces althioticus TaxID=83380 RepID=UPI0037A58DE5
MGEGRLPLQLHAGNCHMASKPRRPVDRDEVRCPLRHGTQGVPQSPVSPDRLPRTPQPRASAGTRGTWPAGWLVACAGSPLC